MKIDAGKLDRRLTVMTTASAKNEYGEIVDTDTVATTIYAQRLELRQTDVARASGRDAQTTARYLIRHRTGLTVGQRVACDGVTYQIAAIDEPDRRYTLVLTCDAL